jgi:hypothetical protein
MMNPHQTSSIGTPLALLFMAVVLLGSLAIIWKDQRDKRR